MMKAVSGIAAFALLAFAPAVPLVAQDTATQSSAPQSAVTAAAIYDADIVARYPHDPAAFTQGLLWHDGALYESTGREGQSQVRRVDPASGRVLASQSLPAEQFGEGLAEWKGELINLTWRNGVVHRWKVSDLSHVSAVLFPYVGWGIATAGEWLVASDGSATLRFLDPATYALHREVHVTLDGKPVGQLNELEFIDGLVYANIWHSPFVVAIDPADGAIKRIIDLRPIVEEIAAPTQDAVLNGIAWDAKGKRLFVTGKLWPTLFEIKLVARP